jgi:branched-chain amino acid transport system substrate-binding protein
MPAALLASAALTLTACAGGGGAGGGGEGGETLTFGFVTSLAGPAANAGMDIRDGALLAVKVANDEQLLDGFQLELAVEDDRSSPEDAVVAYQRLRSEGVNIVGGSVISATGVAIANQVGGDEDAFYVGSGLQSQYWLDEQPGVNLIGINASSSMYTAVQAKYIAEELKPSKVAFVGEKSDFGDAELAALKENWSAPGSPEIVTEQRFESTVTDFTSLMTNVRQSGADAIYASSGSPVTLASIFTQVQQQGLDDRQRFFTPSMIQQPLIDNGGEAVEGLVTFDLYEPSYQDSENEKFVALFEEEYGKLPNSRNVMGWETVMLLVQAMDKAGTTTDMTAIGETLRSHEWHTPRGMLTFDETGRPHSAEFPLVAIESGAIVLKDVYPAP